VDVVDNFKHKELTGAMIGCAMRVHRFFGNGFQEVIYQRALALEFAETQIEYDCEVDMSVNSRPQRGQST